MNESIFKPYFIFCFVWLFLGTGTLTAQDIHYSMFNRSPMNLSPGLIGVFAGNARITTNYKQQWETVPVDYRTFTTTLEYKLTPCAPNSFTLGAYFNNDEAGDLALKTNQIGGAIAYLHNISSKSFLSGGFQVGGSFRRFNADNIQVDVQYEGDRFNGGLPHQENSLFDQLTQQGDVNFWNLAAGINYRYQNTDSKDLSGRSNGGKRTRVDIGAAIYHFNRPANDFNGATEEVLSRRLSLYGISSFKLLPNIDLGFLITGQFQNPHQEVLVGVNGRFYLEDAPMNLLFGVSYRVKDAIIPNISLDYRNLSFGFSYDINVSKFHVATNYVGGPEFSVIWTFAKACPDAFKICPIY